MSKEQEKDGQEQVQKTMAQQVAENYGADAAIVFLWRENSRELEQSIHNVPTSVMLAVPELMKRDFAVYLNKTIAEL